MSSYYKLESSHYVSFGIQNAPKLGEQSVMTGSVVDPSKLPPLVYEHNFSGNEPLPHFLTGGTVLASQTFLNVLDSVGVDNYQAFPATFINPDTHDKREDYFLFNVLGLVQAANLDESRYDELMPGSSGGIEVPLVAFQDLVLDSKRTQHLDMFRLAEEPITIVVSDSVVEGLKQNKPEGGWGIVIEQLNVSS
ncbi:MAG: hypothetical protein EP343_26580 [Deltaproteobacteria bacterium]|nr:MAG: hypothetical protein EP343_26580 [Deltaproteobacteria bacterium]